MEKTLMLCSQDQYDLDEDLKIVSEPNQSNDNLYISPRRTDSMM